jgi:hypothetical protein
VNTSSNFVSLPRRCALQVHFPSLDRDVAFAEE